jgi:hypothetical protein
LLPEVVDLASFADVLPEVFHAAPKADADICCRWLGDRPHRKRNTRGAYEAAKTLSRTQIP